MPRPSRPRAPALRPAALALAVAAATTLGWQGSASAQPAGATAIHGSAQLSRHGASLMVTTQNGAGTRHSVIDWRSFSVPAGSLTHFFQPGADSTSINRVTGSDPSAILGTLSSNGRLVLVNPAGIAVGSGASVDTAGFTASTLRLSEADAVAGRLRFEAGGTPAPLSVHGRVLARGGDVFLLGTDVAVAPGGVVQAPNGSVVLAAGQRVELTGRGLEGIRMQVAAPTDRVVHLGRLEGDAVGIFASVLQHSGVVQATTVARIEDKLYLRTLEAANEGRGNGSTGGGNDNAGGGSAGGGNDNAGGGNAGGGSDNAGGGNAGGGNDNAGGDNDNAGGDNDNAGGGNAGGGNAGGGNDNAGGGNAGGGNAGGGNAGGGNAGGGNAGGGNAGGGNAGGGNAGGGNAGGGNAGGGNADGGNAGGGNAGGGNAGGGNTGGGNAGGGNAGGGNTGGGNAGGGNDNPGGGNAGGGNAGGGNAGGSPATPSMQSAVHRMRTNASYQGPAVTPAQTLDPAREQERFALRKTGTNQIDPATSSELAAEAAQCTR